MRLTSGTQLGPYQIQNALGAGGMGEVYRARDTRLDRSVAIKVLSAAIADDPATRTRFEREARAIAALDHPHICSLYDVGEVEGTHFLVMPLLDGQTLAGRLEKGALPLAHALTIAIEIADALDKAHRQGIVHRDLKPANVMLTKSGTKLLDFGLAKLRAQQGPISMSGLGRLATTNPGTAEGLIIGTVHYMSPEQVEGKDADARSDVWALGVVIYEMVTGSRPFSGDTAASVIGAILKDEARPLSAPGLANVPLLDGVIARCLAKDAEERWQSAADVRHALKWIREAAVRPAPGSAVPIRRRAGVALALMTAVAMLTLAALAPGWLTHVREVPRGISRLSINPPPTATFSAPPASVVSAQLAMSPDGRSVVFVAEIPGGRPGLWVRPIDSLQVRLLPGTEDAIYPFWSPDGRSLGFFSRGKLKTTELAGGLPTTLTDAPLDSRGGTWNREGTILFAPNATDVIYRISASGGPVTAVTQFDTARAENSHRFPSFLPDGRHFIYAVRSQQSEHWGLSIASLDSPVGKALVTGTDWGGQVVPPGYLLYLRGPSLVAQAIDLDSHRLNGEPVALADNVGRTTTAYASFSSSSTGDLIYASRAILGGQLRWFNRRGDAGESVGGVADQLDFELSPDDRSLAVSRLDEQPNTADVWVVDLVRRIWSRATTDRANDASPLWSPDGTRIAFRSNRRGNSDIFHKRSSGSAAEQVWFSIRANLITTDWSADDRHIVFTNVSSQGGFSVWTVATAPQSIPTLAVQSSLNALHGKLSPDGRWLAYASDESGQWEVYVRRFPDSEDRRQISANGGSEPRWRRDGRELFFLSSDMTIMSAAIPGGDAFAAEAPTPLFQTRVPLTGNPYRVNYAVSRDGQRILVNVAEGEGLSAPLTVLSNWPALLSR
jgi:serine/threonine protein kinase